MKKFLFLLFVGMMAFYLLSVRSFFFGDRKKSEEEKTEEVVTVPEKEKEEETETVYEDIEGAYRMLDFDRRLILSVGQQDTDVCSIFTLAYARAILDSDYSADPYDYYDGDGAVWRWADYEDIAYSDPLPEVLRRAYDEINNGRPTIFYVSGNYGTTAGRESPDRISGQHFVLIIGYRLDADYDDLKPSDFYAADPSGGYCYGDEGCMPWVMLTDDAPELMSGEYALFADNDARRHVDTCIANLDTSRWDDDLSEAIYPDYLDRD